MDWAQVGSGWVRSWSGSKREPGSGDEPGGGQVVSGWVRSGWFGLGLDRVGSGRVR